MDSNLNIYEPLELAGPSLNPEPSAAEGEASCQDEDKTPTEGTNNVEDTTVLYGNVSCKNEESEGEEIPEGFYDFDKSECDEFTYDEESFNESFVEEEENPCRCSLDSIVSKLSQSSYKGGWARFGLDVDPWNDKRQPTCRVLDYDDLELTEEEMEGVLTDRIVYACSSFLDKNPETQGLTLAKLVARDKYINDIQILEAHRFLQYIDLSFNNLRDIWPLSGIPYLMHLNVSHNELTELLNFNAPWNLTYVDFSYNCVTTIKDLSDFWSLVYLDLSNNEIRKIEGLKNLRYLNYLNLSMNLITCFENLDGLFIEALDLSHNNIRSFEVGPGVGMHTMLNLSELDISHNQLKTLAIFKDVYHLRMCNAEENEIAELYEIDHMKTLRKLTELNLSGNGMTRWPKYRHMVINTIRTLTMLDQARVDTQERISATVTFDPDVHIKSACHFARMQLLEEADLLPSLGLDIMPVDQGPYPIIVLVGPDGSMKESLINWLVTRCPDKVYKNVSYTSRIKTKAEVDGKDFHFVTQQEFNELARTGTFLYIDELLGDSYGFSRHEIEKAVKQRKLCLAKMEILGALTLKAYGLEPFLVLTISEDESLHQSRLSGKYRASIVQTSSCSMASMGAVSLGRRGPKTESQEEAIGSDNELVTIMTEVLSFKTSASQAESMDNRQELSINSETFIHDVRTDETLSLYEENEGYSVRGRQSNKPSTPSIAKMSWLRFPEPQRLSVVEESLRKPTTSSTVYRITSECASVRQSQDFNISVASSSTVQQLSKHDSILNPSTSRTSKVSRPIVQFQDTSLGYFNPEIYIRSALDSVPDITSISGVINVVGESNSVLVDSKMMLMQENSQSAVTEASSYSTVGALPHIHDSAVPIANKDSEDAEMISFSKIKAVQPSPVQSERCSLFTSAIPLLIKSEEAYIKSIINTRETYFKTHHENPGTFAETIFTDDIEKAQMKLEKFVKETYTSQPSKYPVFNIEEDKSYQSMIAQRLEQFKQEIYNEQRTMNKQLDEMARYKAPRVPPQRSPSVIDKDMKQRQKPPTTGSCRLASL